ncbi:MAG TPA: metallophosphoesterase [Thermomicrobiaceae bacterium]|nr:metallophosphoesterase [Thermomicrobiaceae bacterium]
MPALAGLAATGAAALAYAARVEPRHLRVRRFAVSAPDLDPNLEGARLAFMSDFHMYGPGKNRTMTERAVAAVVAERPDMVLLGGDFYDHAAWYRDGTTFAPLAAMGQPVFAVLGNHDFRGGRVNAREIVDLLGRQGVEVLRNRWTTTTLIGQEVIISGVDDPYLRLDDLPSALAGLPGGKRPLALLAHAPSIVEKLPVGAASFVLSGHTHGGQIRVSPWQRLTPLDISFYLDQLYHRPLSRLQRGFQWERGCLVYVTNGVGMTRWPLRFCAPPEVVMLTVTTRPVDPSAPCDATARYVRSLA